MNRLNANSITYRVITVLALLTLFAALPLASQRGTAAGEPAEVCPLLPGMAIPPVAVTSLEGEVIQLDQLVRQQPTVLIFFRGGW